MNSVARKIELFMAVNDFPDSPHDVNKKAYVFKMGKGLDNGYSSKFGFNVYVLPKGEYGNPGRDQSEQCFLFTEHWSIVNQTVFEIQPIHRSSEQVFFSSSRTYIYQHEMSGRCTALMRITKQRSKRKLNF